MSGDPAAPAVPVTTTPLNSAGRRRWVALVVVCFAMLMNSLDQTIVNVALPTIERDLRFSQADLSWVIDGYLITFGGALLIAGRLGDLIGRKKIFIVGVALFTVASLACGTAEGRPMLIAARFVQGLGAALSSSVILAIIVTEFPDPLERARAMSAYVFVAVGGGAIGLLVGGALTQALSWHWIFFINVPIGIATLILGWHLIDENEGLGIGQGIDWTGAVLSTGGLGLAIYAIVTAGTGSWHSPGTLVPAAAAVVALAAFVLWERRCAEPMIPLQIFKVPGLVGANLVRALTVVGIFAVFFIGALFLQHVVGLDTLQTGFAFLPLTVIILVLSVGPTARIMHRLGPKRAAALGLAIALVGLALFASAGADTPYVPQILVAFALVGLGAGILFMPLVTMALAHVPAEDAGLGSGVANVTQQMAGAVGVAVLGSIAAGRTTSLRAAGHPARLALYGGYHLAFVVAVGSVALAFLVTLFLLRDIPPPDSGGPGGEDDPATVETEALSGLL